jgi:hypothetical protein
MRNDMLNRTNKILPLFIAAASLFVISGLVRADPPDNIKVYTGQDFMSLEAQTHLKNMIKAFNDEMEVHNLIISSLLLSTIKTGGPGGDAKNRARARSATAEEREGKICVTIEDAFAGVKSEKKSKMTDNDNPTDVETCFVWFPVAEE